MNSSILFAARRRRAPLLTVALLACGVLAAPALASPARHGADLAISFVSVAKRQHQTRVGVASIEDAVQAGRPIGTDLVSCTFERHVDRCRLLVTLPRGTITSTLVGTGASLAG